MKRMLKLALTAFALSATCSLLAQTEGELLIWINGDKGYNGLAEVGKKFEEELGIKVIVETPEAVTDRFFQAAQAGKGPDIFFWAHDRLGEWADAGLLRPLDISSGMKDKIHPKAWDAFTHRGQIWAYPVAMETVSLIYNKKLIDEPPTQLSEIPELHEKLKEEKNVSAILWDYNNTYFTWGVLASDGAYVFKKTKDGYDVSDVGVNTKGAKEALKEIVGLIEEGYMPRGANYSIMDAQMNNGRLAMMISGPWAWSNLNTSGIDFGIAPIPGVNGEPGKPFIGVLGAMINRSSPNRDLAIEFMENYVLTDEGLRTINNDVPIGVPATTSFFKELAEKDEKIKNSMTNVENGELMPNVPQMGRFWSAMEAALSNATNGQISPEEALDQAARQIER